MNFDKVYYIVDCTYMYEHRVDSRLFKDKNKAIKEAIEYGKKEWTSNWDEYDILTDNSQIEFLQKSGNQVMLCKTLRIDSYDVI